MGAWLLSKSSSWKVLFVTFAIGEIEEEKFILYIKINIFKRLIFCYLETMS